MRSTVFGGAALVYDTVSGTLFLQWQHVCDAR
jgi:hypothetical protein